ncbi:MAG TPA: hypothetical protein VFZ48_02035 [Candidatus Saccharimonadales bacterium]
MFKHLQKYATLNNAILLAALLLTLSWIWGTMEALQRNFTLQQEVTTNQREIELLGLETQSLEFQRRYYASSEYLELSAREHLGKAKPGEHLLLLPNHGITDTAKGVQKSVTAVLPSNFQQWVTFFFAEKEPKR